MHQPHLGHRIVLFPSYLTSPYLTFCCQIVREIRGMVDGNVIKCEYDIPNVNATSTRDSHITTFQVLLGNGTTNGSKWKHINIHCR